MSDKPTPITGDEFNAEMRRMLALAGALPANSLTVDDLRFVMEWAKAFDGTERLTLERDVDYGGGPDTAAMSAAVTRLRKITAP